MTKYVILVESCEAKASTGNVVTHAGTTFAICDDDGYHTAFRWPDHQELPPLALVFNSKEEAEKYAAKWKPHPWYVKPRRFEAVAVEPRMVQQGWRLKKGVKT